MNVGDKVVLLKCSHTEFRTGSVGTIEKVTSNNYVILFKGKYYKKGISNLDPETEYAQSIDHECVKKYRPTKLEKILE